MSKFNDLPIHIAAEMGNNDAIELLLKHGATLDTHNNDGMFPINHAASRGIIVPSN